MGRGGREGERGRGEGGGRKKRRNEEEDPEVETGTSPARDNPGPRASHDHPDVDAAFSADGKQCHLLNDIVIRSGCVLGVPVIATHTHTHKDVHAYRNT